MMIWCFKMQSTLLRLAYKNYDDLVFYGPVNNIKVSIQELDDLVFYGTVNTIKVSIQEL